jgi:hypothetical protein
MRDKEILRKYGFWYYSSISAHCDFYVYYFF